MRRSQGVTVLELIVTLGIAALLGSIAIPSFAALLRDNERTTAVNAFVHTIFLARSEAIKRGQVVSICKSRDREHCSGNTGRWDEGWIVFVNRDRDDPAVRDANEPVVFVNEGWRRGSITSTRGSFSFRPYTQGVVNGTVVFCDARGSAHARAIIISHSGRPRISNRSSSNRPLSC